MECYAQYRTHVDYYQTIIGFGGDVEIKGINGQISYAVNNALGSVTSPQLTNGQWYHFALVREAGVWQFYIDGVAVLTQQQPPSPAALHHYRPVW
jgi:hypothetical protein